MASELLTLGVGAQLGYQFSFFDNRFMLDLIMFAPSITFYEFVMDVKGDSNFDVAEYYPELAEFLTEQFDWIKTIQNEEVLEFKGHTSAVKGGARLVIQLGYRF